MGESRRNGNRAGERTLTVLESELPRCRRCPELRGYCEDVAKQKRRSFADWRYWGKPVPSFGDHAARIMIVGLAPAAHGANRTGRMFTGDRSGDFLYAALHRAGLANQPCATHREDGLLLKGVYIGAAAHCAPPANRPTPTQLDRCSEHLVRELQILRPRVALCLGGIAWDAALKAMSRAFELPAPRPRPKFAHAAELVFGAATLLGCYHVSQQNTFTGRLTPGMLDRVLSRAVELADTRQGGDSAES